MNKLDAPNFDDHAALENLSNNFRVRSFPRLQRHVAKIKNGYDQYIAAQGNVSAIMPVAIPNITGKLLRGHYASPNTDLPHIKEMRTKTEGNTCPMCGSLHSGTLDHVMPKEAHPAFAIFGKNLVPACKCNSRRGSTLVGRKGGERILHPYFDNVLRERILSARFDDLGAIPRISVHIILDPLHPDHAAVRFHLDSIVRKTGILTYLAGRWAKLITTPRVVAADLRRNPDSRNHLETILRDERDRTDESRDSKNNWDSVFLSGLLDDHVVNWIFATMMQPGRRPNAPLL